MALDGLKPFESCQRSTETVTLTAEEPNAALQQDNASVQALFNAGLVLSSAKMPTHLPQLHPNPQTLQLSIARQCNYEKMLAKT